MENDFKINYRQGASNSAADALSRNVALKTDRFLYTMSDEYGDIIAEQKDDHFVSDVRDFFLKIKSPKGSPGYNAKVAKVASNCFLDKGVVWYNLYKHGGIGYPVVLCPDSMKHIARHLLAIVGSSEQWIELSWDIGGQASHMMSRIFFISVLFVRSYRVVSRSRPL